MAPDQELFLSADERSLNIWSLNEFKEVYNVINFNKTKKNQPPINDLISSAAFD